MSQIVNNAFSINNYRPGSYLSFLFMIYTYNISNRIYYYNNSFFSNPNNLDIAGIIFGNNMSLLVSGNNFTSLYVPFNIPTHSFNFSDIILNVYDLSNQYLEIGNLNCTLTPRNCSFGESI